MIIRRDDINGDFVFGHGMSDYLTANDGVALLVTDRLLLWLGEWFLDIAAGVDWPSILGTKPPAMSAAETAVRECIIESEDVTEITAFSMAFDHKTFIVDISARVSTVHTTNVPIEVTYTFPVGAQ